MAEGREVEEVQFYFIWTRTLQIVSTQYSILNVISGPQTYKKPTLTE